MRNQIHRGSDSCPNSAPMRPPNMNPTGARAPRIAKQMVRILPGGYVLPIIAVELGTAVRAVSVPLL